MSAFAGRSVAVAGMAGPTGWPPQRSATGIELRSEELVDREQEIREQVVDHPDLVEQPVI